MSKAEKVFKYADEVFDNPEKTQQLFQALQNKPEVVKAAEQIEALLQAAAEAEEEAGIPSDVEDALDEGLADTWLRLSIAIKQKTETVASGLQKVAGISPQLAALGTALLAMKMAQAGDPKAGETVMKLGQSIMKNDSMGFIEGASDLSADLAEQKKPLEDQIAEAVMDLLAEDVDEEKTLATALKTFLSFDSEKRKEALGDGNQLKMLKQALENNKVMAGLEGQEKTQAEELKTKLSAASPESSESGKETSIRDVLDSLAKEDNLEAALKDFKDAQDTDPTAKKVLELLTKFLNSSEQEQEKALPNATEKEVKLLQQIQALIKGDEPEAQQADQLDTKAAEQKYGEALKQFLNDNEYLVVVKFLAILMKGDLIQEGPLQDAWKVLNIEKGWSQVLKQAEKEGIFTKEERKTLISVLKDPERSKQFVAAIQQTASPDQQDQQQADKEEKPEQKPQGIGKVDFTKLKEAYDGFAGREGKARNDSFFYPNDNTRRTQGVKLQALYSQIRILLKLDIEDLDQIAAAINDDSLSADVTVDAPANKPKETKAGAEGEVEGDKPAGSPAKRDLYEQKIVELRSLTTLRDLIRDAELVVSEYERVVTTGIRGSKQLYSKYSSQLGKDAYNPKKVLYSIVLKDIVKIANAFIATLDSAVKKYRGPNPIAEAMLEEPWDNVVAKVKAVFQQTVSRGQKLIQLMVDHKPESDAPTEIRSVADEIYKDLTTILEYYPLSKPFETDAHGVEGFAIASKKLNDMFQMVNTLASQFQNNEKIASLEQPAKVRLHSKMEELKQLVIDTFAGQYDPKPSINDETTEDEFNNAVKDEEGDKPEDSPEGYKEVDDYLKQEDSFYQKVITTLKSFEDESSDFFGQNLQENMFKKIYDWGVKTAERYQGKHIEYLKVVKEKVLQFEEKYNNDRAELGATGDQAPPQKSSITFELRNTMQVYKQLLEMYKMAYEQFKARDYDMEKIKAANVPEVAAVLRSDKVQYLEKMVGMYTPFYQAVEQISIAMNPKNGEIEWLKISRMMDEFLNAGKRPTKVDTKVKSAALSNKSITKLNKKQTDKLKNQSGGAIKRWFDYAKQIGQFIIGGDKAKIDIEFTPKSKDVQGGLEEAEDTKADWFKTAKGVEEKIKQIEPILDQMKNLMSEFLGIYITARTISSPKEMAQFMKDIPKAGSLITQHANDIKAKAEELYNFVQANKLEVIDNLAKLGSNVESSKPERSTDKYKSVIDKVTDQEQKEALQSLLMFLTGEAAGLEEIIKKIISSEMWDYDLAPSGNNKILVIKEVRRQLKLLTEDELGGAYDFEGAADMFDPKKNVDADKNFDRKDASPSSMRQADQDEKNRKKAKMDRLGFGLARMFAEFGKDEKEFYKFMDIHDKNGPDVYNILTNLFADKDLQIGRLILAIKGGKFQFGKTSDKKYNPTKPAEPQGFKDIEEWIEYLHYRVLTRVDKYMLRQSLSGDLQGTDDYQTFELNARAGKPSIKGFSRIGIDIPNKEPGENYKLPEEYLKNWYEKGNSFELDGQKITFEPVDDFPSPKGEKETSKGSDKKQKEKRMTDEDIMSNVRSLKEQGFTIKQFRDYLRKTLEAGDEVYFDYVGDKSTRRFRLLEVPEDMTQEIELENESTNESITGPFDWLENYFKNPTEVLAKDSNTRLDIKIESSFDPLNIDPSAEKEPLEEQLVNKLKPVIKEMMRGNYG